MTRTYTAEECRRMVHRLFNGPHPVRKPMSDAEFERYVDPRGYRRRMEARRSERKIELLEEVRDGVRERPAAPVDNYEPPRRQREPRAPQPMGLEMA